MSEKIKVDISVATMVKVALTLFAFYLLYLIKDILALLFVVLILVAAFRPVVESWGKKIGRIPAVIVIVLIGLGFLGMFIGMIVPPLVEQTRQLINNLPGYINQIVAIKSHLPSFDKTISSLSQNFGNFTGSFISLTIGFFGGLVAFFTAIILTIYFLLDEKIFISFGQFIPATKRDEVLQVLEKISQKVGNWLRGQLLLSFIVALLVYIGLSILHVPYALTIAVFSGLLEFIPVLGPIISGGTAALIALSTSYISALIVVALYLLISQIESTVLVPKIMQKAIGLPPAIIIIAILIGGKLFGLMGGLMAVPLAGIIFVVATEWPTIKSIAR